MLDLNIERDEKGFGRWEQLIDTTSIYKLLYTFQIIESFMEEGGDEEEIREIKEEKKDDKKDDKKDAKAKEPENEPIDKPEEEKKAVAEVVLSPEEL